MRRNQVPISRSGVLRLLNALTVEPEYISCRDCQDQIPMLVDAILAGANPIDVAPEAMAHLDHCPECKDLFIDVLGEMQELPEPAVDINSAPDLSFLQPPLPATNDPWRPVLDATEDFIWTAAGSLKSINVSFRIPDSAGLLVREKTVEYSIDRPDSDIQFKEQSGKLLYHHTFTQFSVAVKIQRKHVESVCRIWAEVERSFDGAPRPALFTGDSGENTWTVPFDENGIAAIESMPVIALTNLDLTLKFDVE